MRVVTKWKRRIPWPAVIAVLLIGFLGMSVAAHSETYNFYFEKKKPVAGEDAEAAGPPAPPPAPAAAAAPIVINNTNNVGTPSAVTTNNVGLVAAPAAAAPVVPVAPAVIAAPPAVVAEGAGSHETVTRPASRSPWRVALTGMAFLQKFPKTYISQGEKTYYQQLEPTWGGLLSLGYNFSRVIGVNLYGGLRVASNVSKTYYHAGADLEITPFRIPVSERHDLLEIGLLVGGSTAMASGGNWGTIHAGARVNVNIVPEFGITASARANLGYLLFEGGLVARL